MTLEKITISVDADAANAYYSASEEHRRKLDLILNLRLRDVTNSPKSLKKIMDKISRNAQKRGLTPELLENILDDK